MKAYDKDKPLISIHVPKCGGTSFRAVLKQWFGANFCPHYFTGPLKEERPRKYDSQKGTCIHGHFNGLRKIGVRDYYPQADQFITMLRDPFEMELSHYFHAKGLGDKRFREGKPAPIQARFADLRAYLDQRTCYLVNFFPAEVTLETYEEMFERQFVYVGITEDLQTSVDVLARRLGFPSVGVGRLNTSVYDEEVTAEMREEFVAQHPLEYAIYHYATKNYKQ